jgi:hypothetical protein
MRPRRHAAFLQFLYAADPHQRKDLVTMASDEQLKAFREIALNLYAGHPPVSGYYKTILKVHKDLIQSLSDRTVDNTVVKKLLRKHVEAVPLILKPHFKDGRGVPSGEKDDVRSDETESERD